MKGIAQPFFSERVKRRDKDYDSIRQFTVAYAGSKERLVDCSGIVSHPPGNIVLILKLHLNIKSPSLIIPGSNMRITANSREQPWNTNILTGETDRRKVLHTGGQGQKGTVLLFLSPCTHHTVRPFRRRCRWQDIGIVLAPVCLSC